jgi:phenylpropionate dioxygenase-like ring-hydroxylating dioxygenase large terminal subunit
MLTKEQNALLTQTGRGTPAGELLRRYWQPVALAEELPPVGPPLPVRLLGEDLVLFRDDQGRPGLLGLHCAHRGADLSYGRLEDGGLRCLYHGWLYDVEGRCLEQPGEPAGSTFCQRVRQPAYPCQEAADLIFAYLGPGEPPLLPAYEPFGVPTEQRFVTRMYQECNYLQGNEGDIDPAHISFLHRQFQVRDPRAVPGSRTSADILYNRDVSPTLEVEETDYGLRIFSIRQSGADSRYVRTTNFIYPNLSAIVGNQGRVGAGYSIHWHVPIDDEHHWRYEITFSRTGPLDKETYRREIVAELTPDRRLVRNRANRYLQDRAAMLTENYTGMGRHFAAHDAYATESQGAIQDRTQEHLGYTDKAIARARQALLQAIRDVQEGRDPPHVLRTAAANHFPDLVVLSQVVPEGVDWRTAWRAAAGPVPAQVSR